MNTGNKLVQEPISSQTMLLSRSEKDTIRLGCLHNCRVDGRACDESRRYKIVGSAESSSLPLVSGSARLMGHGQHILCSIKAEVVKPSEVRPNEGVVELHVDSFVSGSNMEHDQASAVLSQLLAEHLIDKTKLCIVPRHYAWRLHIDLYILSSQCQVGSFLDASSHLIRAALRHTLLPSITPVYKQDATQHTSIDLSVDGDIRKASPPHGDAPIIVTVSVVKCSRPDQTSAATVLLVDATPSEQVCSYAQIHVAVQGDGFIVGVHKSQSGSLPMTLLTEITQLAVTTASKRKTSYSVSSESLSQGYSLLQGLFAFQ